MSAERSTPSVPYPFRYVGLLLPRLRQDALDNLSYQEDKVADACAHVMSRASKEEFLTWVGGIWDEAEREFHDVMSNL